METLNIAIFPRKIITKTSNIYWYSNEQMSWHIELKNGKWHGGWKQWGSSGEMFWHKIYENGEFVKRIL